MATWASAAARGGDISGLLRHSRAYLPVAVSLFLRLARPSVAGARQPAARRWGGPDGRRPVVCDAEFVELRHLRRRHWHGSPWGPGGLRHWAVAPLGARGWQSWCFSIFAVRIAAWCAALAKAPANICWS